MISLAKSRHWSIVTKNLFRRIKKAERRECCFSDRCWDPRKTICLIQKCFCPVNETMITKFIKLIQKITEVFAGDENNEWSENDTSKAKDEVNAWSRHWKHNGSWFSTRRCRGIIR